MQRRAFLEWTVHGLGAVFATVLGVPAVAYLIDARNRPARETDWRTVARFGDLAVGVPTEVVIKETRRDAWNLHPDDIVGRVWLIRQPAPASDVSAFTTICPHLGCSVNWVPPPPGEAEARGEFLCPCHGGRFKIDGQRVTDGPSHNPAPRNMDSLEVRKAPDPDDPAGLVVQVRYLNFKKNQATQEIDA